MFLDKKNKKEERTALFIPLWMQNATMASMKGDEAPRTVNSIVTVTCFISTFLLFTLQIHLKKTFPVFMKQINMNLGFGFTLPLLWM